MLKTYGCVANGPILFSVVSKSWDGVLTEQLSLKQNQMN